MTNEAPTHPHIADCGREWIVELDVADFTASELRIEADHGMLTIVGDRPAIGPFEFHEHLEEAMRLPPAVDTDRATACYRNGSLEIRIPKLNGRHRVIPIESDGSSTEKRPCLGKEKR
jgi:HSP20 family molecular chaperone IbpA